MRFNPGGALPPFRRAMPNMQQLMKRVAALAIIALAEVAVIAGCWVVTLSPAAAQIRDDRYPWLERRRSPDQQFEPFGILPPWADPFERRRPRTQDRSQTGDFFKAPTAKKPETQPTTSIVVFGDSMADWLAYGLEEALSDNPEIGVVRKIRTYSGLIRNDARSDDLVQIARDLLASERPDYIVIMLGVNDRQAIRERVPSRQSGRPAAAPAQTAPPGNAAPGTPSATEGQPAEAQNPSPEQQLPPRETGPGTTATHEFRSERWSELYIKRIDDMTGVLRSKGVPVLWVGLPPVRGTRSKTELTFLNEIFRSRADKNSIGFVDVWEGFVDEDGNFMQQGPDYEGQIRRLRTSDGVHFTKAGALKLGHYVEREIQRLMTARAAPMAMPGLEQPQNPAAPGETPARAAVGPVVPLTGNPAAAEELAGAGPSRGAAADPVTVKVLLRGEAIQPPSGRADDFAWPKSDSEPDIIEPVAATPPVPPAAARRAAPAPTKTQTPPEAAKKKRPAAEASSPAPRQVR
jgi:hypothetical protein